MTKTGDICTARCHCGRKFEYTYRGQARRVCTLCIEANTILAKENTKQRRRLIEGERQIKGSSTVTEAALERVAKLDMRTIAEREGISWQRVQQLTRTALYRIRNNPDLKKLWAFWKSEGSPIPKAHHDLGEQLLEWELELGKWWVLHDLLQESDCTEEADEILKEIELFQTKLTAAVIETTAGKG